jgi:AbrB family looped-hinge helix DNA binding protein
MISDTIPSTGFLADPLRSLVQDKGQVTIPSEIRKLLDLKKGDLLAFVKTHVGIVILAQQIDTKAGTIVSKLPENVVLPTSLRSGRAATLLLLFICSVFTAAALTLLALVPFLNRQLPQTNPPPRPPLNTIPSDVKQGPAVSEGISPAPYTTTNLSPRYSTNLLRNPSFEAGNLNSNPRLWDYLSGTSINELQVSLRSVRTGNYALKYQPPFSSNGALLRLGLLGGSGSDLFQDFLLSNTDSDWTPLTATFANVPLGKYPVVQLGFGSRLLYGLSQSSVTTRNLRDYIFTIWYRRIGSVLFFDDLGLYETNGGYGEQTNLSIGAGAILVNPDGLMKPVPGGSAQLGDSTSPFTALYLSNTSIDSNGNFSTNGNVTVGNNLTVNGITSFNGTNNFSGTLSQTGNATISGTLGVGGNASLSAYLTLDAANPKLGTTNMRSLLLGGTETGSVQLSPKNTTGLFVDGTGNVGIGTTGPSYKFDISGVTRTKDLITEDIHLPDGNILTGFEGFSNYVNASGGLGTGGISRISRIGNLTNIGSIQAGELLLTGGGTFAAKVDYSVGAPTYSIALADLNGDGKPDLITSNWTANTASVFINNGSGTFASKVDYGTGSNAFQVVAGDLNGDGKADLAITNYGSNTVSVLINNGDGTFATKVDYGTGSGPRSISLGDLNGDGKPDLAITNFNTNTVSVLLNNGDGTFASEIDYTVGSNPFSIAMGDLNGDGKEDLAVVNHANGPSSLSILMNNGDGTFAPKVDYATETFAVGIAMGDLNGDGKPDLAVGNVFFSAPRVAIYMNNGDGTFAARVTYVTGGLFPESLSMSDVNGDGKLDLLTGNRTNAGVWLNNGDGTLATPVNYTTGSRSFFPNEIATGDLNGDGKPDMVTANKDSNTISVLMNNATTMFYAQASSGNVAVGTSSPLARFQVFNSSNTQTASVSATNGLAALLVDNTVGDLFTASSSGLNRFVIKQNGNVGIGTTAPGLRLDVRDSQSATAAAMIFNTDTGANGSGLVVKLGFTGTGASTNHFINFLDGNGRIQGSIQSNGANGVTFAQNGIADFAEYMKAASPSSLPAGTVVCQSDSGVLACDQDSISKVIGIRSDHPAFLGGVNSSNAVIVGFVGQVPVRIASDSSAIAAGDFLTVSASYPGLAQRSTTAGYTVAKALEGWSSGSGQATILASINLGYSTGDTEFAVNPVATISGSFAVPTLNTSPSQALDLASVSAQFGQFSDTLKVIGKTQLGDTTIGGKLAVGLITIDDLKADISAMNGLLSFQHGAVQIDGVGNITTAGTITASKVRTDKLEVTESGNGASGSAVPSASIGQAIIPAGQTRVEVKTTAVTSKSRIFVTPRTETGDHVLVVKEVKPGESFLVTIKEATSSDISFDWWIVN